MNIAVLSLTRDRLGYTEHCFGTLRDNAGCDYDHFVFDNGSTDGSADWCSNGYGAAHVIRSPENVGICRGLNRLLDVLGDYDVLVRFDNDCEVLYPDTLRTVCGVALRHEAIVAPRILGLMNPPPTLAETSLGRYVLEETAILGGIFMAIPASLFSEHGFRYDESQPLWGGDELIVPWWRRRGGRAGYLRGWAVNHYKTTLGQVEDIPWYFARRVREGGRAA